MVLRRFPTSSGYLYYGPVPTYKDLQLIQKRKIDVIWNLGAELGHIAKVEKTIVPVVLKGNVEDFSVPSNVGLFMSQVRRVAGYLKAGKKVFVHCHGGRGRTGMTLAALKIAVDGISWEKALKQVKTIVGGPDTQEQKDFVEFYTPYLRGEQTGQPPKFPVKPKQVYDNSWFKYKDIDWNQYMQNLPQREIEPASGCDFCGNQSIKAIDNFDGKKVYLCGVCKTLWANATDAQKKEWLDD